VVSNPVVDIAREEERMAEARPAPLGTDSTGLTLVGSEGVDDGGRRRQDYSKQSTRRKDVQFGEYMLGQTLGEGEFGKVKLGWKKDGSVQVAIKLIRRESVATNPSRLPKIYREISILRELSHPNIVRLHEMVETDRHIGIILEYASGGELFDYILNHRYLKDPAARRLFAQLVSGVGYLHKKGIVHRDLKLENLLLDRNRNIIITDFGFANTFNPADELSDEVVYNLSNRDFVKKYRLDRQDERGMRKGDLMQTSCGSPCYAAPELVVSDSLYTGRKVDVWSCGVILVSACTSAENNMLTLSSMQCWQATCHSMTIQPTQKEITSIYCTSTSLRPPSPFPSTLHPMLGIFCGEFLSQILESGQIYSKLRGTAGLANTTMWSLTSQAVLLTSQILPTVLFLPVCKLD
jgi:protein-serine/threonine kinase